MPRGNDAEGQAEFDTRLFEQYGIHPNAQALIDAHQASIDPALTRAQLTALDPEATDEAKADLDDVASKLELDDDNDKVVDAAVRGNALVAVVENGGMLRKVVGPWNDKYEVPALSPADQQRRAEIVRDQAVAKETARLKAEADAKIAEARAEMDAHIAEEVAKIKEEKDAELAKKVEELEADDAESSPVSSQPNVSGGDVPRRRRASASEE